MYAIQEHPNCYIQHQLLGFSVLKFFDGQECVEHFFSYVAQIFDRCRDSNSESSSNSWHVTNLEIFLTQIVDTHPFKSQVLCNGWEHYVPYRCLQISNKLCDSTLCTCGGVEEQMHNVDYVPVPQLETNIKIASAGDRTRVTCVTGGHST